MPTNPIPTTPNLKAYYKADTGLWQDTAGTTAAVANTDPIARWDDQSGNGYHVLQTTAVSRPTLLTDSGYHGLPAVRFDPTANQEWLEVAFPWTSGVTSCAMIAAFRFDALIGYGIASCTFDQFGIQLGAIYGNQGAISYIHRTLQGLVMALVFDGSQSTNNAKLRAFRNGNLIPLTIGGTLLATNFSSGSNKLFLGRLASAGLGLKGRIMEFAFFSSLSDADRIAATNYLGQRYFAQTKSQLFFSGDSRTAGAGTPTNYNNTPPLTGHDSYPLHTQVLLGTASWDLVNAGTNGQTWSGLINADKGAIDAYQDDWRPRQPIVAFADTNDFVNGHSVAQVETDIGTYFNDRIAAGFKPSDLYCATSPWNSTPAQQSQIPELATWQRTPGNLPAGVKIIDYQADPRFGSNSVTGTANYTGDGVHMSDAGNAALASIAALALVRPNVFRRSLSAHSGSREIQS